MASSWLSVVGEVYYSVMLCLTRHNAATFVLRGLLVLLCLAVFPVTGMGQQATPGKPKQEPKPSFVWARPKFFPDQRPITKSATCRFKQSVITMMLNAGKDYHPAVEYIRVDGDEADTVSFTDLDTENPKVVSNGGQASLVVLMRTQRAITLGQTRTYGEADFGEFEAYTIFPETGVVIHSTNHLVGVHPSGVTEMGWCN